MGGLTACLEMAGNRDAGEGDRSAESFHSSSRPHRGIHCRGISSPGLIDGFIVDV